MTWSHRGVEIVKTSKPYYFVGMFGVWLPTESLEAAKRFIEGYQE